MKLQMTLTPTLELPYPYPTHDVHVTLTPTLPLPYPYPTHGVHDPALQRSYPCISLFPSTGGQQQQPSPAQPGTSPLHLRSPRP